MIKALNIRNFQSHRDTELQFVPGVNVIVGPSDSGKTAILRALRWLVWNRPQGDALRSTWGGKTSVELLAGKALVVRSKDKEEEYVLGNTSFRAFKTDVPEEISQVLNLNEINLQQQLDTPFLLSSTSGEVASHFNRVAGLNKIDVGTQKVQSWIREISQDILYKEKEEREKTEELTQYDNLDKFESELEVLEGMEDDVDILIGSMSKLKSTVKTLRECSEEIKEIEALLVHEEAVTALLQMYDDRDKIYVKFETLSDLVGEIRQKESTVLKSDENVKKLEKSFHDNFPDICPLCGEIPKKIKG